MHTLSTLLIDWYSSNHRHLPWRDTRDPYKIWISEIILQQTRVNQGLNYYLLFIKRFPNVKSLAEAPEQEVLIMWQGLGYYSRARNLHAAALQIINQHQGAFPNQHHDILSLKGIGEYTAAAIASFAFDLPYATVDGNVFRVLSRYHGISTPIDSTAGLKEFRALAQQELNPHQAALHNQAMMEFGALHCTPLNPDCTTCPLQHNCKSVGSDLVKLLPVKAGRTQVKEVYLHYFVISLPDGTTLLRQRTNKGIWHNLYDYPCIESSTPLTLNELTSYDSLSDVFHPDRPFSLLSTIEGIRHQLSHRTLITTFYTIRVNSHFTPSSNNLHWIHPNLIDSYPVPRLISLYRERIIRTK